MTFRRSRPSSSSSDSTREKGPEWHVRVRGKVVGGNDDRKPFARVLYGPDEGGRRVFHDEGVGFE